MLMKPLKPLAPEAVRFLGIGACIASLIIVFLVPEGWIVQVFDGTDGARWFLPFAGWMIACALGYFLILPRVLQWSPGKSTAFATGAIFFLGGFFLFVSLQRLFSGALRPLESYSAVMVLRISQGLSIYPDPEVAPLGTIYGPLYFLLAGALQTILPVGINAGRLVSIGATLITAWQAYCLALKLGGNREAGLWASALFLSTYGIMDKWYDRVATDSLLTCLLTTSLLLFLDRKPTSDFWALLLAGAAAFTKQPAALVFFFVGGTLLWSGGRWRVFIPVAITIAGGCLLLVLTNLQALNYLVFAANKFGWLWHHPFKLLLLALRHLPILIGFGIGCIALKDRRFLGFAAVVAVFTWAAWLKPGGWVNSFFPLEPILCASAACTLRSLPIFRVLLLGQMISGIFNPFAALNPWNTMRASSLEAVACARRYEGDVWFPVESELYAPAKKKEWDNLIAAWTLPHRLTEAIERKQFQAIIISSQNHSVFTWSTSVHEAVQRNYTLNKQGLLTVYLPLAPLPSPALSHEVR